ncbi:Oidioi.mRNA.OKI2018_I69.chr1.g1740.t2.cds [Oikopleura dioica]|uniref:Oidioi.mRNA.OKI2018_I69.chr1.g1740.t2.cds n=1 Tax=Oikopleura dioica TaxID=34765 RepID=A0ABN7SNV2_OIKDI|nr:Oidioi.mRNA.OKI2018_I69.chr1.g1740.t2.cds [Oikopleura dioica]
MVKYAKQVRKASWWVIITSILLISLDIIVVTNQALFDFMPSYGIGMIAGCLGVLAAFLGLRASKEKSAVIFFSSFKRVSILATFGAICAMGGVLWLGIIFSIHTVCLEKVDVPLHYDSLFLNQTCYNFVDDWTYENETSIDSTDDGSGEYSGDGSGEEIDIFEERFSRPVSLHVEISHTKDAVFAAKIIPWILWKAREPPMWNLTQILRQMTARQRKIQIQKPKLNPAKKLRCRWKFDAHLYLKTICLPPF